MPSRVRADFPTFANLFRFCAFSTSLRGNQEVQVLQLPKLWGRVMPFFDRDRTKHVSFLQDQERKSLGPATKMLQLHVPLMLTMAIVSPSCGSSAITSLYSNRRRLGIVYAAEKSYGETSAGVRALVSSLTAMVNAIGGKGGCDGSIAAVRTRQFESLSKESVLEGLRTDFEVNQYLWSGKITPELCMCTVSHHRVNALSLCTQLLEFARRRRRGVRVYRPNAQLHRALDLRVES